MSALGRGPLAALIALAAFLVPSAPAGAQSLFEALFGGYPAYRAPAPAYLPSPFGTFPQPVRRRLRPKPAVTKPDSATPGAPVMPATAKPAREVPDAELVASFMSDRTLRRGDIVVFPDGPRVFRGDGGASHKPRDFEDLRGSSLVAEATRRTVLAGTRTVFAHITVSSRAKPRPRRRPDVAFTGGIR